MRSAGNIFGVRAVAGAALWGVVALCLSAAAQPGPEDKALATALFQEGRDLIARERVVEACRKFQESQRLDPSGGTLLNLAHCHEQLGRIASAWTEYHEALAWARRDGRTDRIRFAIEHLEGLEPRLSHVVVEVPPAARIDGLEVRRDGNVVREAAWGSEMPVDPGRYVIEATAEGHRSWRSEIEIDGDGDVQRIVVPVLVPASQFSEDQDFVEDVAGPEIPERDSRDVASEVGGSGLWPAYLLAGVGVAGLGVGSYFGLQAFSKNEEADEECLGNVCTGKGQRLKDEAGRAADISTVAFAVGIVATGAGVTYWLLDAGERDPGALSLVPAVGPGQAGLQYSGRF